MNTNIWICAPPPNYRSGYGTGVKFSTNHSSPARALLINPVWASLSDRVLQLSIDSTLYHMPLNDYLIIYRIYICLTTFSLVEWLCGNFPGTSFGTSPSLYKYIFHVIETFERSVSFLEIVKPASCDIHVYDSMIPFLIVISVSSSGWNDCMCLEKLHVFNTFTSYIVAILRTISSNWTLEDFPCKMESLLFMVTTYLILVNIGK